MKNKSKDRIHVIDVVRGLAIIGVLIVHTIYDVPMYFAEKDIGRICMNLYGSDIMQAIILFGAGVFVFLCGVSMSLSKSNLLRGIRLLAVALIISAVTYIVMKEEMIWFGIIHCLSVCVLLSIPFSKWIEKINAWWIRILLTVIFVLLIIISDNVINNTNPVVNKWLFPLGFVTENFASADYYPLLPWFFVFVTGMLWGKPFRNREMPAFLYKIKCSFLEWCGKHCLLLYLVQQPLTLAILYLISN